MGQLVLWAIRFPLRPDLDAGRGAGVTHDLCWFPGCTNSRGLGGAHGDANPVYLPEMPTPRGGEQRGG
jgi:hypothetical protein